jgi:RND family efflux transporter MFP subunit
MNQVAFPPEAPERAPEERQSRIDPDVERRRRRLAWTFSLGALLVVAGLVGVGAYGHAEQEAATIATLNAQRTAVPVVRTMAVKVNDAPRDVELPGSMQAFDSATLFARATGYIAARNVDIGSRVRKGDVLAVIAAPDLDQQLSQARAQLDQAKAALVQAQTNADLAKVTSGRTSQLVTEGWSSRQQGDTDRLNFASAVAAVGVARANVEAQQAQVNRLAQLASFEKVTAPFDGTITARQIDVGSLVTADASSGTPLFSIARTDILRVRVYVPQEDVFGLKDGSAARVTVPELPGEVFRGTVSRNAHALQPGTRTLLTEVDVDNKEGRLTAGLYGIVHLAVPRQEPVILVPSEAVIFNKNGLSAAVLENGTAHLRHLDLAADDGAQVEVRAGLKPGDDVILSPPVNLTEGMRVQPAKDSAAGASPG